MPPLTEVLPTCGPDPGAGDSALLRPLGCRRSRGKVMSLAASATSAENKMPLVRRAAAANRATHGDGPLFVAASLIFAL